MLIFKISNVQTTFNDYTYFHSEKKCIQKKYQKTMEKKNLIIRWNEQKKYNDLKNVKAYVFQNVQVSKALGFTI